MKRVNFEVQENIFKDIKRQALEDDVSLRTFLTRAVLAALNKNKEKK